MPIFLPRQRMSRLQQLGKTYMPNIFLPRKCYLCNSSSSLSFSLFLHNSKSSLILIAIGKPNQSDQIAWHTKAMSKPKRLTAMSNPFQCIAKEQFETGKRWLAKNIMRDNKSSTFVATNAQMLAPT
jgi:hypothetical protein